MAKIIPKKNGSGYISGAIVSIPITMVREQGLMGKEVIVTKQDDGILIRPKESSVVYTIDKIRDSIIPVLIKYDITKAILFGSYAYGKANEKSDIDIYVESKGKIDGTNYFELYAELSKPLKKSIDLITSGELDKNSLLAEQIEEGLTIYEKHQGC